VAKEKVPTKKSGVEITQVKMHQEEPAAKKGKKEKEPQKKVQKTGGTKKEAEPKAKCPMASHQEPQKVLVEKPVRVQIPPINIYEKDHSTNPSSPQYGYHSDESETNKVHDANEL